MIPIKKRETTMWSSQIAIIWADSKRGLTGLRKRNHQGHVLTLQISPPPPFRGQWAQGGSRESSTLTNMLDYVDAGGPKTALGGTALLQHYHGES